MPAVISVVAYEITRNPALRPLARTLDDMAIYRGERVVNTVIAYVRWTAGGKRTFTRPELADAIKQAFASHGVTARVKVDIRAGTEPVTVSYKVGANLYGPVPVYRAADGVKTAVAAYKMYRQGQSPDT
jgi:hypothetical protein